MHVKRQSIVDFQVTACYSAYINMISYSIVKKSKRSSARAGIIHTPHGDVETPALVGVATQATVKTLTSDEVVQTGSSLLIANTFHLHLKPGEDIVKRNGGLHDFMHWDKALMTDSGGYQVFSLGFGRDHNIGKIVKEDTPLTLSTHASSKNVKITSDGVYFNSPIDGKKLFIGPKESIAIQQKLGADIIFAFDECTPPIADRAYTQKSMDLTHTWAHVCVSSKKSDQSLFSIIQGGKFKDLRIQSAKTIASLPVDGFGIGGELGFDKKEMFTMLGWVTHELPENKPRHLLGNGHIDDLETIFSRGVDTLDCIIPTHYARHGVAFTAQGKFDMSKSQYLSNKDPLDILCSCMVCQTYSKSYLCHLIRAKELTALRLLSFHNLFYFNGVVASIRQKILDNKI